MRSGICCKVILASVLLGVLVPAPALAWARRRPTQTHDWTIDGPGGRWGIIRCSYGNSLICLGPAEFESPVSDGCLAAIGLLCLGVAVGGLSWRLMLSGRGPDYGDRRQSTGPPRDAA